MVKIAVLASFNMDLVMRAERRPRAGETLQGAFAMFPGGKGFNQAVAARRLGAQVAVAGRVGADEFGRAFIDALDAEGIERSAVVIDPVAGTGVASIIVEADGTNTIVQAPRANRNVVAKDFSGVGVFDGADAAMVNLETNDAAAIAFLAALHGRGHALLNPAPARTVPQAMLDVASVVVANETEAETITGLRCDSATAATDAAARLGSCGVVTLGGSGAVGVRGDERTHVAAHDIRAVDTVGAGDAFCAALAVRMGEGAPFAEAVRFANAAGAIACTRAGALPSMPRREEVEALLRKGVPA
jgi:ribokinase